MIDKLKKTKSNMIHNRDAYNDMMIGSEIFDSIDRTITRFGKKKLKHRLEYCQYDVDTLQQLTLKNYTAHLDSKYRAKMETLLHDILNVENCVIGWMENQSDKDLLFDTDILNNRLFLTISNGIKMMSFLLIVVVYILIFLVLYYYDVVVSPKKYVEMTVNGYYQFSKFMTYLILSNEHWVENIALTLTVGYICYIIYTIYQGFNQCYQHYGKCNTFYDEYLKLIQYVQIVEDIYHYDTYENKDGVEESIDSLKYYFSNDQTQSLGFSLITKLNTKEYIDHMNTISNYVGRIDCLITITKLLDEGYTVPTFVQNTFPILHIERMGHPSIPQDYVVKNSLIMDVTQPNVMILTGPNKAGKSTYMRSIIISTYLAQSLGICCAERMSLTPFRDICTYLNVPDTIGRESLFEAEINRCYNYIEKTESLRGFSLGIIDELFTGTNSKEGKAGTYAILKKLSVNPTNITILSTHYNKILYYLTDDFILNRFTVNISKNQYTYDYKIKSGISDQFIGLELLKEKGFDKEIIDNAIDFIERSRVNKKLIFNEPK